MPTSYTNTTGQTQLSNLITTAYDKYVEFALRSEPLFRAFADKRPVDVTSPGASVVLQRYQDLAPVTTPLVETQDPDAVAVSNTTQVTITLNEYGNVVLQTALLDLNSISSVDPAIADILAYNMRDSLDGLVSTVLNAGTNVIFEKAGNLATTGPTNTVTATDTFKSRDVRYVVAKLRGASAIPYDGGYYMCLIHPDVSHDLRAETGAAAWRDPHNYSGAAAIWAGEIGAYEGARFVETPRTKKGTDGASSAKVHRTLFLSKQALAEAVSQEPGTVVGPVVDKLARFRPLGWKGVLGWAIYRQESLFRVETSSSI